MTLDHLAHLRADCDAILAVIASADLAAPVAACPGWDLRATVSGPAEVLLLLVWHRADPADPRFSTTVTQRWHGRC